MSLFRKYGKKWVRASVILRFKDGVTREHATYNGEMIKQADVNLLGYPLYFVGDAESQRRIWNIMSIRLIRRMVRPCPYSVFCCAVCPDGGCRSGA